VNDPLHVSARRLAEARQRGDADDLAEALAGRANELVRAGRMAEARALLDEAASIHHAHGRVADEARYTQLAGTLCRLEGDLDEAESRCRRALELCGSRGPIAVSAHAELGETALARGDAAGAAAAFRAALDSAGATALADGARAALLRKRAVALTAGGCHVDAIRDLRTAHGLLVRTGDHAGANRSLVEQATAYHHAGLFADAERIVRRALGPAERDGDHAALADLHLLLSAQSLDRRDTAAALSSAQLAREAALAAHAPTSYIGAAHAIAGLADSAGDRVAAYGALATGWVTVGDLLGADLARMSFEPALRDLRKRWGAAAFEDAKRSYEATRRGGSGRERARRGAG
jgi:tetratricopeptide (TPR) repeat protein